jgi:hypothetical protein
MNLLIITGKTEGVVAVGSGAVLGCWQLASCLIELSLDSFFYSSHLLFRQKRLGRRKLSQLRYLALQRENLNLRFRIISLKSRDLFFQFHILKYQLFLIWFRHNFDVVEQPNV